MRHPASMTAEQIQSYRAAFVGYVEGGKITMREVAHGVCFTRSEANYVTATGFSGKAIKPAFHYTFRTAEARDAYVEKWVAALVAAASRKAARREERKADKHGFLKGTILYASWGYEQTNIDWYEVVEVVSDKTVVIRKIAACLQEDTGPMSGNSVPAPGHYTGEPMRKRATSRGVSLASYSSATVWDGQPKYCSWYH